MTDVQSPDPTDFAFKLCLVAIRRLSEGVASEWPNPFEQNAIPSFDICVRHRLVYLFAEAVLASREAKAYDPTRWVTLMADILGSRAARIRNYRREAVEIQTALSAAGVASLARKGIVYDSLFGGHALRSFDDLDFYVLPGTQERALNILREIGYIYGRYDVFTRDVQPLSREELLVRSLYPDHLPTLVKMSREPLAGPVEVDISFNMLWHGHPFGEDGVTILTDAFSRGAKVNDIYTAPIDIHFIDCALHLFREAFFENMIRKQADVALSRFLDLTLLWVLLSQNERIALRNQLRELPSAKGVAWAAFHTDSLFGTNMVEILDLHAHTDADFPQSWIDNSGRIRLWSGTIQQRLFAQDRTSILTEALSRSDNNW